MTTAVVYAFAVQKDLSPVVGAAPYDALSRQLPRLAVHLLNGTGDRGLRFFPFLARDGGTRRFLQVEELIPVDTAVALHGQQPAPQFVVDGRIGERALRLRILEVASSRVRFDDDVPFDPASPLAAVSRLMFELTGVLGWGGGLPRVPDLSDEALSSFLVARDALLRLEAEVGDDPREALRAATHAYELAPADTGTRDVLLEICGRAAARGVRDEVAAALRAACHVVRRQPIDDAAIDFCANAANVLDVCDEREEAIALRTEIATLRPHHPDAASRAASAYFEQGRLAEAGAVLRAVLDAGNRSSVVVAQLALIEERLGDVARYADLVEELVGRSDLSPPMVRIAVSHLLDQDRMADAAALVDRALAAAPDHPDLLFDLGRVRLLAGDEAAARAAFEGCLAASASTAIAREAERCLRMLGVPEAFRAVREIDRAMSEGDLTGGLALARRLARRAPRLAEGWLMIGVARQRLEQPRRAERAFRRALAEHGELGEAHNRLGILLVARKQYEEGYRHLREAVRLLPDEPSARIHLAQACHYLGRLDEGRGALEDARRLGGARDTIEAVRAMFYS